MRLRTNYQTSLSHGHGQNHCDVHCTGWKGVLTLLIAQLFFDDAREVSGDAFVPVNYATVRADDVNRGQSANSKALSNVFASEQQTVCVVFFFHHRYGIALLP